uniref:Truncated nitrilotriacetate monooxygenase n=1 Tax=Staphylococcus aureus TaxID=1280 RepID=I1W5D1_STAAU|nr:truncated nitrilotriacetate monooxygenase [Staphylococcus aureus]
MDEYTDYLILPQYSYEIFDVNSKAYMLQDKVHKKKKWYLSNQLDVFHVKLLQAPLVVQNNKKYCPFLLQKYIDRHLRRIHPVYFFQLISLI